MRGALVWLALMCLPTAVSAQDPSLTLAQAVALARRQNPDLRAAAHEADSAREDLRSYGSPANPTMIVSPTVTAPPPDLQLEISQPLDLFGQRAAQRRMAGAEADAAAADYRAAETHIVRDVKDAYYDLLAAQAVLDLNQDLLNDAKTLHLAAQKQYDLGVAPRLDIVKSEIETTRARQSLLRAQSALAVRKAALNELMGRDPHTPFRPASELQYVPVSVNLTALTAQALASRPDVQSAQAQDRAATLAVTAARRERLPSVEVQLRRDRIGSGPLGWGFGVGLPLFDYGSITHQVRGAQAHAAAQRDLLTAKRNAVGLEVEKAVDHLREAQQLVESYRTGILADTEQAYAMTEKGYRAGAFAYLDLLEAQRTLRSVKTEYYTALAGYAKAVADLEYVTGGQLPAAKQTSAADTQRREQ